MAAQFSFQFQDFFRQHLFPLYGKGSNNHFATHYRDFFSNVAATICLQQQQQKLPQKTNTFFLTKDASGKQSKETHSGRFLVSIHSLFLSV
jgi:hypothetical protein